MESTSVLQKQVAFVQ